MDIKCATSQDFICVDMLVELMSKLGRVSYFGVEADKCYRGKEQHMQRNTAEDNMVHASIHSHSLDT